jgi:DNA topoisomerase-1
MPVTKSLVIVESPAKARTIAGYLGKDFVVESSIGHIRDLPRSASDIPPELKGSSWARLGVDVDNDFRPLYVLDPDKRQHIGKLKKLLKEADQLFLATDEDREGESIAWHLLEVLSPKVPVKRMVFHEITKRAIQDAIAKPREIDRRLVDAQEARRILDRLYGYEVSPVLWKKVAPGLSAGRVQSVATRIVVDRERERMRFRKASYWDIEATLAKKSDGTELKATLFALDGKRLATGKDFSLDGKLSRDSVVLDEAAVRTLTAKLAKASFSVASVERKPYRRSPYPPFMTSTLQQEAGRKLRFSAQQTMRVAQRLYESGYITYMRTDSTTLSDTALAAARKLIAQEYGSEYLPARPREYANKVKNAQEAHEAIRPAGDTFRMPDQVAREVSGDEARLYELVWKRTVASQMEDVRGETLQVRIEGRAEGTKADFTVSGRTIAFPGFYRAYVEGSDDPEAELETREKHLPPLAEGEGLVGKSFAPQSHETQAPARFTEASLVRALEEMGVGRPSTYASIIGTIQQRDYVWKKGPALVPSFKAFAVVNLLEQHFPQLVDYAFTARMEDELDSIASGEAESVPWLQRFYFGADGPTPANQNGAQSGGAKSGGARDGRSSDRPASPGLKEMVSDRLEDIDAREINSLPIGTDGRRDLVVRVGRYGSRLMWADSDPKERRWPTLPDDLPPDELTVERAVELLDAPSDDRVVGVDPESGEPIIARKGRFGPYVQLGDASGDRKDKPKTASLFKSMSLETIGLDEALALLKLPREVGVLDGEPVVALNGRYGPYIQKGKETRSLDSESRIFTVTLAEAAAILAQPKQRGQRRSTEPLRTLGNDPVSGQPIVVKEGRFGPYVTDGETMASLRKGDAIEDVTTERAAELLAGRRERGPSTKRKKVARKAAPSSGGAKAPKRAARAEGDEGGMETGPKKVAKKTSKKVAKKTSKKVAKKTAKNAAQD